MTDPTRLEEHFAFGANWQRFARGVDEARVEASVRSIQAVIGEVRLDGLRVLDAGSGSGLSSLAFRRLGARVHSFDFDPDSVACTRALRDRFQPGDGAWTIERGSVLDAGYLRELGSFDLVYSWGVLHHTGDMWRALDLVTGCVAPGGRLWLALYNHQVYWTTLSTALKRAYHHAPPPAKALLLGGFASVQVAKGLVKDVALRRWPLERYRQKRADRGMSAWYDWVDWVGGYPFETVTPEQVFDFYRERGFVLDYLKTANGGHGCNEWVFRRGLAEAGT